MGADYAASEASGATGTPRSWRFRPQLIPTLAALVVIPVFISLGNWQWNKARAKEALQESRDSRGSGAALAVPGQVVAADALRDYRVTVRGEYDTAHQILLDNRVHQERAGYHVLTPIRIAGSDTRILVNRGWIPAAADHAQIPEISTPQGVVEVTGVAVQPSSKFFALAPEAETPGWQQVWQNLDMSRYAERAGIPLQPVVIQMDADSPAGGFVREWPRPDDRREKHLSYALQWWAFAAATVAIWLFVNLRRR